MISRNLERMFQVSTKTRQRAVVSKALLLFSILGELVSSVGITVARGGRVVDWVGRSGRPVAYDGTLAYVGRSGVRSVPLRGVIARLEGGKRMICKTPKLQSIVIQRSSVFLHK